jgi:glycosyltransferase involved in cell wall biosynthesis
MDIVMISSGKRLELLEQSLNSLRINSVEKHNLVVVLDGCLLSDFVLPSGYTLITAPQGGASRARNIGASSIPKYRRSNILTFLDDDVYLCKGWDKRVSDLMEAGLSKIAIVSGHAHPYNQPLFSTRDYDAAQVLSTVHISMSWNIWDDIGFFVEPGGKGGSEDVEWCSRAVKYYPMFVLAPQCVIHCGIKDIVGKKEMEAQNEFLVKHYNLKGVKFS